LLVLGDDRGSIAAREELNAADSHRVVVGLTLYRDARLLPPLDVARTLSDHPQGEVRRYLAQALAVRGDDREGGTESVVVGILQHLASDTDPVVALTALDQLWKH